MGKTETRTWRCLRVRWCPKSLGPSKSSGCVLRRSYECLYHKVDETRREKICYFDFMSLYPTSRDYLSTWSLFQLSEMHGASTQRSLPSRATLPSRRQTHLSALCLLHDRGNVQTLSGAYSCLYSHRFGTPTCRDLVHTRTPQGYWEGIHSRLRTRSVAFPDHSQRALQRLREHVAQDQGRGQRVAESRWRRSPETSTTLGRLQRQRGDRIGPGKDREKSRTAYAGQDDVKLHVG